MEIPELLATFLVIDCQGKEHHYFDKQEAEEHFFKEQSKYEDFETWHILSIEEAWQQNQKIMYG